MTGPVARFARQIAGQGYICAAPSSYHEFTGPEPLQYNAEDTDSGNKWKITKKLAAYDEDASLSVDYLLSLPTCNGHVGATGMCLGGHLAYRCALDKRVKASVCYFATDVHSHTLAEGKKDDSLERAGDIEGELLMVGIFSVLSVFHWPSADKHRSSAKTTRMFLPKDAISFGRPCMRKECYSASMRWHGRSVCHFSFCVTQYASETTC